MIRISGNTFPVKDQLKGLGGQWSPAEKCWLVPENRAEEARKLVGQLLRVEAATYRHALRCKVCGSGDEKIYRSGECQSCFEERKMGY